MLQCGVSHLFYCFVRCGVRRALGLRSPSRMRVPAGQTLSFSWITPGAWAVQLTAQSEMPEQFSMPYPAAIRASQELTHVMAWQRTGAIQENT